LTGPTLPRAQSGLVAGPHLVGAAGLLQRLTVGVGWLWLTLVAAREIRADRRTPSTGIEQ
jgi:hypothetical protein